MTISIARNASISDVSLVLINVKIDTSFVNRITAFITHATRRWFDPITSYKVEDRSVGQTTVQEDRCRMFAIILVVTWDGWTLAVNPSICILVFFALGTMPIAVVGAYTAIGPVWDHR